MLEKDWRENDIEPIRCAADKGTGEGPENKELIARSEQREKIRQHLGKNKNCKKSLRLKL